MIDRIIHWVYCLPIANAVVLALAFSGGFFWMYRRYRRTRWWKTATVVLLTVWTGAVLAHTLLNRGEEGATVSLIPLQTYITVLQGGEKELLRSAFMNVLLFYPGGLLMVSLFPKWRTTVVMGLVLASISIEVCQYFFRLGFVEVDDILHNALGAVLGAVAFRQFKRYENNPKG